MDYTTVLAKVKQTLEQRKDRSAWGRGVNKYAVDMLQQIADYYKGGYISADDLATSATAEAAALNGARDWSEYSWGGCALVYDGDIAAALCNPSELKKTRNGERRPNSQEEWLDVQARALRQAFRRVYSAIRAATVDGLKDQLKQIMQEQNTDTLTGAEHKATYKAVTSSRIDTTALKRELPGVAAQYTRATETRRFTFA